MTGQRAGSDRTRLSAREALICVLLLLSTSVGDLMTLGGLGTREHGIALAFLALGAVLALPGGRLRTTPGRITAVGMFVASTAVAYIRFAIAPVEPFSGRLLAGLAAMLVIVFVFAACALLAPADSRIRRRRLLCTLFSPVCFVVLNLGLYVIGFQFPARHIELEPNTGSAQLLGLFGIHTTRVNDFPLSPGLNGTGEAAALALVICVVLASRSDRRLRALSIAAMPACLATILLTDSRGPLVYAVLAILILTFIPRWAKRTVGWIPVLLPFSPAIVLFVVGHLGSISESFNRASARGSFETATGRSEIWAIVVRFLSHPHLEDLVGYGAYGQVKSGVGFTYAYLFPFHEHPQFGNAHNIALQTILDSGYLGLAIFICLLVVTINSARVGYERSGTAESAALLGGLIAVSLFGATEALPGLNSGMPLLVSLIVLACAAIRVIPSDEAKSSRRLARCDGVAASRGEVRSCRPQGHASQPSLRA